jgi:MerR family transcriptional regulator, light-induced transcriptional regulator
MEDRSPQYRIGQLAAKTGVSPERLRAWEARYRLLEPNRSQGGFRLYSREDEWRVRLMQRHLARGFAAAEAAELARNGIVSPGPTRLASAVPPRVAAGWLRLLREAFERFDEGAAERALDDLFKAFTVEAVLRDVIFPCLREIGDAWAAGVVTPGQEHFASTHLGGRLLSLARGWGTGTGPRALLACPAGERHTLGLVGFGVALARHGWRITFLGEDTPSDSLDHAARSVRPELIVLAAVREHSFQEAAESLADLSAERRVAIAASLLDADPVTSAAQLRSPTRQRPAEAGRV